MTEPTLQFEVNGIQEVLNLEYGMRVADLIHRLNSLPQDALLISHEPEMASIAGGLVLYKSSLRLCMFPFEDRQECLTKTENRILEMLVDAQGEPVSRKQIAQKLWDGYGNLRTTDSHVLNIRSKFGEEASQYLQSVRGTGFVLVHSL